MPTSQPPSNPLFEAVSKVDEIVMCLHDSFYSTDRCPKVLRLERIIRSVDLKSEQLRKAVETGDEDQALITIRRILKLVSRFYRVLR